MSAHGSNLYNNPYDERVDYPDEPTMTALLLLAGYRAWGLSRTPSVPTRWWRGSGRWSLNTLWRAYRAALWGQHQFHPLCMPTPYDWGHKEALLAALQNAVFASARS